MPPGCSTALLAAGSGLEHAATLTLLPSSLSLLGQHGALRTLGLTCDSIHWGPTHLRQLASTLGRLLRLEHLELAIWLTAQELATDGGFVLLDLAHLPLQRLRLELPATLRVHLYAPGLRDFELWLRDLHNLDAQQARQTLLPFLLPSISSGSTGEAQLLTEVLGERTLWPELTRLKLPPVCLSASELTAITHWRHLTALALYVSTQPDLVQLLTASLGSSSWISRASTTITSSLRRLATQPGIRLAWSLPLCVSAFIGPLSLCSAAHRRPQTLWLSRH